MVRRYRHKATGALVTSSTDLPANDWEIVGETPVSPVVAPESQEADEKPVTRPRRAAGAGTRKTASPRG